MNETFLPLLFVGVRSDDAEPILAALRQSGVVARPVFVEGVVGLEGLHKQYPLMSLAIVAQPPTPLSLESPLRAIQKVWPNSEVLAWSEEWHETDMVEAFKAGVWGVLLPKHPVQCVAVIQKCWQVIQDRQNLSGALRAADEVQQRETTLLAAARDPVAYIHEGMHIRANQAYLDFFEIESEEEIEGLPWLDLISSDQANEAKGILKSAAKDGDGGEATLTMQTTHGEKRLTRMKMVKAFYEGEDCLQVTLRPIVEEKAIPLVVSTLSSYEQLANRVQDIQKNPDLASTTALVLGTMADRESFEALGFTQIPEFMRQLSDRVTEENTYKSEHLILDGHVLAMLVFGLSPDQGPQWITEFREKIAVFPIEVGTRSLKPTLALGGVMLGPEWKHLQEDPLLRVEEVWRAAKSTRRAEWFDPAARDREADLRKQALLEHIRHSVEHNQLSLAYRPILPLTGQQLEIYEVFVRMKALEGNQWLRPEQFVLQAEKNGLGGKVDDWVFQNALSSIQDARRQNRDPHLIISMGTTSLLDPDFPNRIVQMAQRKNVPADRLIIQINESVARTQQALVERIVQAKEQWRFELALSRFMGQQESLDLLKWVKPDWVKFDESWTRDLSKNEKQQQTLKLLVAQLHEQNIITIADFVRDSATTTVLFSSQVAHAAGDFLAPEAQVMHVDLA